MRIMQWAGDSIHLSHFRKKFSHGKMMVCPHESCASDLWSLTSFQWHFRSFLVFFVRRLLVVPDAGGSGSDDDGGRGDGSNEGSDGFKLFTKEDIPTFAIALGISFLIRS